MQNIILVIKYAFFMSLLCFYVYTVMKHLEFIKGDNDDYRIYFRINGNKKD